MLNRAGNLRHLIIATPEGLHRGGGIGSVTRVLQGWLAINRPDMRVHVLDPRGRKIPFLWPLFTLHAALRLCLVAFRAGPVLVHLQVSRRSSFIRKGLLLRLARLLGARVVLHHHGSEFIPFFEQASLPMKAWVQRTVALADVNLVLGEAFRAFLVDAVGADPNRTFVLRNAVADKGLRDSTDVDPWHIVLLANLSRRKGVDDLLSAIHQLAAKGQDVRLTLAGSGEVDRYRRMAQDIGIAERCNFTGWLDAKEAHHLLQRAGLLVLPSFHEGFAMSVLEALSAGVPVITTPVGSMPEVLRHEENCYLVEPGDAAGLAEAIERLATNPDLRQRLAVSGRQLYEREFELDRYMQYLLELYDALLAGERFVTA